MDLVASLARLTGRFRQHQDVLHFCLRFSVYAVLAFVALFALQDQVVEPFTRGIAWVVYTLMKAMGIPVWLHGVTIGVENFAVQIRNNCNAIYEMGLYVAASLAYPAAARERATGILLAVAVLYVVNVVRVLSLIYFGYLLPRFFEAAHVYVWQALFLAVLAALWLSWIGRVRPVA